MTETDDVLFAQQQVIRLQALLEASRQIHATTDLDAVLDTTLDIVVQELELEAAFFSSFSHCRGCVAADVLERHRGAAGADLPVGSHEHCYPLYDKGGELLTNIVVVVAPGRRLTLDEADFIEGLSLQAAVAIENVRFHERTALLAQLREEREKARQLLLNILPETVAEALQDGRDVTSYFDDATICFTDFVGFTNSTEHMPAATLVKQLHTYFTAFDEVTTRYGLEKLKTIGDSYMFVGGVPTAVPGSNVTAILAAMEINESVRLLAERPGSPAWQVRIGLHTGAVAAGVVGIRKFAFDIWGAAVNFASRMESSGVRDRINISEDTYRQVRDFFVCEERGSVVTKDNRAVRMFLVHGVQPGLLQDGTAALFAQQYSSRFGGVLPSFPRFLLA